MRCPYCIKICSKCNRLLVANSMNFNKQKNGKYGVKAECKECTSKYGKKYYNENKEQYKQYYKDNKEEILKRQNQYDKDNKEHKAEYYQNNKEHKAEYMKQYYLEHKDKRAEQMKQWHKDNPEYNKQYYNENKEHLLENMKQWNENNRERKNEISLKAQHKRRAKLKSNGGEYTTEQWNECLEFFDYKCAYSGVELNKDNTNVEHIIPISKGGSNNIYNIVPALDSVNFSKNASDMLEWYKEQPYYSEERLNKILDWIEYASNKYELNQ